MLYPQSKKNSDKHKGLKCHDFFILADIFTVLTQT